MPKWPSGNISSSGCSLQRQCLSSRSKVRPSSVQIIGVEVDGGRVAGVRVGEKVRRARAVRRPERVCGDTRQVPLRCATALCFLASLVYRPRHPCLKRSLHAAHPASLRTCRYFRVPAFVACDSPRGVTVLQETSDTRTEPGADARRSPVSASSRRRAAPGGHRTRGGVVVDELPWASASRDRVCYSCTIRRQMQRGR
jgi:hypothetical protein